MKSGKLHYFLLIHAPIKVDMFSKNTGQLHILGIFSYQVGLVGVSKLAHNRKMGQLGYKSAQNLEPQCRFVKIGRSYIKLAEILQL